MKTFEDFIVEEKNPAYKEWEERQKKLKAESEARAKARDAREKARLQIVRKKVPYVRPGMGGTGLIRAHKEFDNFMTQLNEAIPNTVQFPRKTGDSRFSTGNRTLPVRNTTPPILKPIASRLKITGDTTDTVDDQHGTNENPGYSGPPTAGGTPDIEKPQNWYQRQRSRYGSFRRSTAEKLERNVGKNTLPNDAAKVVGRVASYLVKDKSPSTSGVSSVKVKKLGTHGPETR